MMIPKFRAWNQRDYEYINEINAVMSLDGSHIWWDINDSGDMKYEDDPENYKLEQFTGLKDANGKEIYEGDIVCVSDAYEDVDYVDAVIWGDKDDYPAFDLKNHAREYDANALSSIFNGEFETIEVIGNIHENPELVEVNK